MEPKKEASRERASRLCLLDLKGDELHMARDPTAAPVNYSRSQKHKSLKNQWELGYSEDPERFSTDSEKMLHSQRDERISSTLRADDDRRARTQVREFKRLEQRDREYLEQVESERLQRENVGNRANISSVEYDIVTRDRTGLPAYGADLREYRDNLAGWRKSMRALRLQSKSSRDCNVLSWEPSQPCCIPPEKPKTPQPPDPVTMRKPSPARPRNMLHSMTNKCDDVPVGHTNVHCTNW